MKTKRPKSRDIERPTTRKTFIAALRRLADALEAGKPVAVRVRGERVRVPVGATMSIEHEREGAGEELEFQLKWSREPAR